MSGMLPGVAVLGTGLMGAPMAARLVAAGYPVTVWNRTAAKTRSLADAGARAADTPAEAVAAAKIVVLMLADAAAIRVALPAPEADSWFAGRVVLQMGTIAPAESRDLAARVAAASGSYLEAPVLGSVPQAKAGSLLVMVGGDEAVFERWRGVLACFGPEPRLVGVVGAAATLKLALNQVIATLNIGYATSLGMVQRGGVEVDDFAEILRASAFYAPSFDAKLAGILARRFTPANFPARHLLKDVRLIRGEAARLGLGADHLAGIEAVLERTVADGRGDEDYSSLAATVNPAG